MNISGNTTTGAFKITEKDGIAYGTKRRTFEGRRYLADGGVSPTRKQSIKLLRSFTIDRKRWARGPFGSNKLFSRGGFTRGPGRKCCIGFYAEACGFEPKELDGYGTLQMMLDGPGPGSSTYGSASSMGARARRLFESVWTTAGTHEDDFFQGLYSINDSGEIPEHERERQVKAWFRSRGIRVTFKG